MMPVSETGQGVEIGLPGKLVLSGPAGGHILGNTDDLTDDAIGVPFKRGVAAEQPNPVSIDVLDAVFQTAYFTFLGLAHGVIVAVHGGPVVGVNKVKNIGAILKFRRPVAEQRNYGAVAEHVLSVRCFWRS